MIVGMGWFFKERFIVGLAKIGYHIKILLL